jgi:hypothetical protein
MGKNCGGKGKMAVVDLWYLLTNAGGEMRQPPIEAAAEETTKGPYQERAERAIAASMVEETSRASYDVDKVCDSVVVGPRWEKHLSPVLC